MCIRDRALVARKVTANSLAAPSTEVVIASANTPKLSNFISCLLYTSDAADERSSVDLGGRRIIKKKIRHDTACAG